MQMRMQVMQYTYEPMVSYSDGQVVVMNQKHDTIKTKKGGWLQAQANKPSLQVRMEVHSLFLWI